MFFNKLKRTNKEKIKSLAEDFDNLWKRVKILEKQVRCEHKLEDFLWDYSDCTKVCNNCGLLLKRYNTETFEKDVEIEEKKYIKEIEDNEDME